MYRWFEQRLNPYPAETPTAPPRGLVAFCWHYSKPAAGWLVLLGLMSFGIAVAEAALYSFLGNIVDWLSTADRATFLQNEWGKLGFMAFVAFVALPGMGALHSLIMHQVLAGNYPMMARWLMHRYLIRHSINFFANEFAGRVSTKVMQTSLAVRESVMKIIDVFIYAISFVGSMLFVVASADLRLVAPLILWLAIYIGILGWYVPRLRRLSSEQADARSAMTGRIVDSYTNIATIKLFSHAGREEAYARDSMDTFLDTVYRQMRQITGLNVAVDLNNAMLMGLTAAGGLYFWLNGDVTAGAFAAAIALVMRVTGMSHWIMWESTALFENIGTVYDGMDMMVKPHEITDKPGAKALKSAAGDIVFDHATFHYGKTKGVIDDMNLVIRKGEKVGLVGRSGAGKTTLMNLLLRFYDLEKGRITIGGEDIAAVTQDTLRAGIGVVTQDTSLLHRTIRENIAYGHPDASDADIIDAAKRANAWDFIEALTDMKGRTGLDAHVGERGVKLSGGQRQRIAIARVFLKNAPVLILDEATSALDSEVEAAIQENLFALMEGKTVIAIAHRLSTLTEMDRLVILDRGRVVEEGTHDALVAEGGLYADLWNRQSGGFLADQTDAEAEEKAAAAQP